MKKIIVLLFVIIFCLPSFGQKPEKKLLNQVQKTHCQHYIDSAIQKAMEGYPEAMYILGISFANDIDTYNDKYKKYWSKFDPNDNFVAAAYWLKKACENNWEDACLEYADYAYYGRGKVRGGTDEAIKCVQKILKNNSKNLLANANLSNYYMFKGNIEKAEYHFSIVINIPNLDDNNIKNWNLTFINEDYLALWAIAYFHGIGVKQNYKRAYFLFHNLAKINSINYAFTRNAQSYSKKSFYLFYCMDQKLGCKEHECYSEDNMEIFNYYLTTFRDEVYKDEFLRRKEEFKAAGIDISKEEVKTQMILDMIRSTINNNIEKYREIKSFEKLYLSE